MFSFASRIVRWEPAVVDDQSSGDNELGPEIVSSQIDSLFVALDHVGRDDFAEAENRLKEDESVFHKLGLSLVILIQACLGGAQEDMEKGIAEALTLLAEVDKISADALQNTRSNMGTTENSPYPPASAFSLCNAQCQIMLAIIAMFNASVSEVIKECFKFRKAYMVLQSMIEAEERSKQTRSSLVSSSVQTLARDGDSMPGGFGKSDALDEVTTCDEKTVVLSPLITSVAVRSQETTSCTDEAFTNMTDIYIQSGANLCFGTMILALSLVPSSLSLPLRIIGFRGNKEKGLKLLWQATKYPNMFGAMAGLVLVSYYSAIRGACDIIDDESYPKDDFEKLLALMTTRYPQSQFWMLEEARMTAANCKLEEAIKLLSRRVERPLRQVQAQAVIERGFTAMFFHDYRQCARDFSFSVSLNDGFATLYYYIAGSAHVELYRRNRNIKAEKALLHKIKAESNLRAAKKRCESQHRMAKKRPFDLFVRRKIEKWERKAADSSVSLIDAIATSPLEEMIYLWGGYKQMMQYQLRESLSSLSWSSTATTWEKETLDERAIRTVIQANIYTIIGDLDKAKGILHDEILCHNKAGFKGVLKDEWTCPSAHYEMAIILWTEAQSGGPEASEKLVECSKLLDKVSAWESYDLEERVSLKIKTARETLERYKNTRL